MHQEYKESNGMRIDALNIENLMSDHGPILPSRRTAFKRMRKGRGCWMKEFIAINGCDHTLFDRSDVS